MFLKDEQLKSHEAKVKQISTELAEHRSYPPDKKLKGKEVDDYKLKDHYLEFEVCMETLLLLLLGLVVYLGGTVLKFCIFHFTSLGNVFLLDKKVTAIAEAGTWFFFLMRTSLPVNLDPSL